MNISQFRVLPRAVAQPRGATQKPNIGKILTIILFLLPGGIIYTLFLIVPIIQAFHYSLFDWTGFGPPTKNVGVNNFVQILSDGVFHQTIFHTLAITVLSLVIQLPAALLLAILIGRKLKGSSIYRIIFFLPYVFSEVITAAIWMFIFSPQNGLANTVLSTLIPGFHPLGWLGDRNIALLAIFMVITWKYFGLHMILYMAALQQVNPEIEEAARIDGANEFQVLRYMTLPSIGRTIRLTIYLSVVGSLSQFVLPWLLDNGGPFNATHVLTTYMFHFGPQSNKMGYGIAVAIVLFVALLVFSILYQVVVLRQDYQGEVA